uniref:Microtubule-associated protein futsch-like n=1 Tax=Saccoglossus kowalevskii TaxID=10224 RepID=A0ABM0LZB4_SACKO
MVSDSEEEDVNSKRDRRRPVKIPSMLAKVPARSAMASPKTEGSPKKMQKVEFAVKSGSNVSSTSTQEVGTPQSSTTGRRGRKPKNQKKSTTQGTSRKTRGKIPQHTDEEENLTPELEENAEEPKQQVESAPVTRGKKSVTMATKDEEKKTSVARGKRKSVPGRAAAENIDSPEVVGGNRRGKRTLVAADEEVVFKVPAIKMTRTLTDDKTAKEPLHDEKKAVGRRSIRKSSEEEESMNDAGEPSTSTRRGRSRKSVAMATKDEDDVADSVRTIESVNKSVNKRAKRSSVRSRSETEEKPVEEEKTTMTVKTSRRTRNASNNSIKEDPESSMSKDCEIEKTKVAGRKGKQKAAKKTIQKTTVSDDEDLNNTSISSDSTDTSERDGRRGKRSRNTTPAPSTPSTGKNLKVTDRSDVSSPTLRRRSSLDTKPKVMFTGVVDKAGER